MKKSLFKAMVPTIAMLLVALMSLTGVTYAWFTAGDKATVETFELNVKTVDGVLVSLTGFNGTWGSYINPKEAADWGDQTHYALRDVSSAGELDGAELVFFTSEYDDVFDIVSNADKVTAQNDASANSFYYTFDFYIKNEGDAKNINISGSTVTGSALSRAATRIAFIDQGKAVASAVLNDNTAPSITANPTLLTIWEPNDTEHSPDGVKWLQDHGVTDTTVKYENKVITGEDTTYMHSVGTGTAWANYTGANLTSTAIAQSKYYTYTATLTAANDYEHFRLITMDDFYKVAKYADVVANRENYFKLVNGSYVQLGQSDEIEQGKTYYQPATVGASGCDVVVYTKADATEQVIDTLDPVTSTNTASKVLTIEANTIKKVTVYVWIEGQDVDCTNYIAGNPFKVDLELHVMQ